MNAVWDLWAKSQGKPVWRLVADMSPEEYVQCIDFRYITDALTPEEGVEILRHAEHGKAERLKEVEENKAVPIYTTRYVLHQKTRCKLMVTDASTIAAPGLATPTSA